MGHLLRLRIGLVLAGLGVLITPLAILPELIAFSQSIGGSILAGFALIGLGLVAAGLRLPRTLRSDSEPGGFLYFLPAFGATLLVVFTWSWPPLYVLGLLIVAVGALVFGYSASTWGDGDPEKSMRHLRIGTLVILVGAAVWATWYLMSYTSYRQITNPEILNWEAGSLLFVAGMLVARSGLRLDLPAPAGTEQDRETPVDDAPEYDEDPASSEAPETYEGATEEEWTLEDEQWPAENIPKPEASPEEPTGAQTEPLQDTMRRDWTAEEMLLESDEPLEEIEYANRVDDEELVWQEWTGRQIREQNRGSMPELETERRV